MTQFKSHLWVTGAVLVLALAVWIGNKGTRTGSAQSQEPERTLEIERYPDEPLQLVDLRVGAQSVKDRIKPKFKDNQSKLGIDSVKFNEKDDWYKRVSIKLRNTSNKACLWRAGLSLLQASRIFDDLQPLANRFKRT